MSWKCPVEKIEDAYYAVHKTYGDVELIGNMSDAGFPWLWIVMDENEEVRIVYESDLSDFYYWG